MPCGKGISIGSLLGNMMVHQLIASSVVWLGALLNKVWFKETRGSIYLDSRG